MKIFKGAGHTTPWARWIAKKFGYSIAYVCKWGVWEGRYDSIDNMMMRPIHENMSVAPPWARRVFLEPKFAELRIRNTQNKNDRAYGRTKKGKGK